MTDTYLVGQADGKLFIKIVGNATMKNSKTLEDLFNKVFAGAPVEIIFDFAECKYMDSTMLGLLAKTAIKLKKEWDKRIYELNADGVVKASLKSTGVYNLMLHLDSSIKVDTTALKDQDFTDKKEKAAHILGAHKTLMELSEENAKVFKNVVELLEKDLNK